MGQHYKQRENTESFRFSMYDSRTYNSITDTNMMTKSEENHGRLGSTDASSKINSPASAKRYSLFTNQTIKGQAG